MNVPVTPGAWTAAIEGAQPVASGRRRDLRMNQGSVWNSLEIAKLVVSVLTPLAVVLLGIAVTRASKRAEAATAEAARIAEDTQWANRRAVDRLVELHKEMAPLLNNLMCFFQQIGHFREIDPPDAVADKRQLDRIFYANEYLFSPAFRQKYRVFMSRYFAQWESPGQDAKMKTSVARLRAERGSKAPWDANWDRLFENMREYQEQRQEQRSAYKEVMSAFANELGLSRTDRVVSNLSSPNPMSFMISKLK